MNDLQIIESRRGKPVILHSGYQYNKREVRGNKNIYWTCVSRKCRGSVTTDEAINIVLKTKEHTCGPPNVAKTEVALCVYNAKKRAREECTPITTIYKQEIEKVKNKGIEIEFPNFSEVKSALYNARHSSLGVNNRENINNAAEKYINNFGLHHELSDCDYNILYPEEGVADHKLCLPELPGEDMVEENKFEENLTEDANTGCVTIKEEKSDEDEEENKEEEITLVQKLLKEVQEIKQDVNKIKEDVIEIKKKQDRKRKMSWNKMKDKLDGLGDVQVKQGEVLDKILKTLTSLKDTDIAQ